MSSTALTVQIQGTTGVQTMEVSRFVNSARVASDLTQPVAEGFKRVAVPVQVNLEDMRNGGDVYRVGGGKVGISGRVYADMRKAAGIQVVRSESRAVDVNGEPGIAVTVWCVRPRPGMPAMMTCKSVSASYADFFRQRRVKADDARAEAQARYFMPRQLETAALNRATRELLGGEPTCYKESDLRECGGLFLVFADVPDPAHPTAQRMLMQQSIGAAQDLFGVPPQSAELPAPSETAAIEPHEIEGAAGGEPVAQAGGGGDDPFATVSSASEVAPPAVESVDLPDWCKGFARDEIGEPRWETLPAAELKTIVRRRLHEIAYDFGADTAQLLDAGKAGQWAVVADKLLAHERRGGGNNA